MKLFALLLLAVAIVVPGCNNPNQDGEITEFFAEAYEARLALAPMWQTGLGRKTNYDKLDDVSAEAIETGIQLMRDQMAQMQIEFDLELLSAANKENYNQFIELTTRDIAFEETYLKQYVGMHLFNRLSGVASFMANSHTIESVEQANDYISRLKAVKTMADKLVVRLQDQIASGVVAPAFTYELSSQTLANVISGKPFNPEADNDSVYLADFKKKLEALEISDAAKEALLAELNDTLLNYTKLGYENFIAALEVAHEVADGRNEGVWSIPGGEEQYEKSLSFHTTTSMTADEVHELGLAEVSRIHGEMREIMTRVNYDGTLQEFFNFMRDGEQFYYPNTEEGKQAYLDDSVSLINTMKDLLPQMFDTLPQAEMEVRAVEAWREDSAPGGFYQSPALDGSRPGIYYVNLKDMKNVPKFEMEALAYHEGLPGHHMQIAIAQELEGIPEFRKDAWVTAFGEGWALYSEKLPKEFGAYSDPYSDYGRLSYELLRSVRLVVDTGVHAKRWSLEESIDYMVNNMSTTRDVATTAMRRYIVWPGQATAYKIGMNHILKLREDAKSRLGDRFDLGEFHDVVITNGSITLETMERLVNEWVASKL